MDLKNHLFENDSIVNLAGYFSLKIIVKRNFTMGRPHNKLETLLNMYGLSITLIKIKNLPIIRFFLIQMKVS